MNVSSANYVSGNGVYGMQQIDDDKKKEMEELRIKYDELEKRCEEQENEIIRLRQDLEKYETEWSKTQAIIKQGRDVDQAADECLSGRTKTVVEEIPDDLNGIAGDSFTATKKLEQKIKEANVKLDQYEPGHMEIDLSYLVRHEPLNFDFEED